MFDKGRGWSFERFPMALTAREIVLDAMLLLFAGFTKDDFTRPGLQEVIDDIWQIARRSFTPYCNCR
ncbi:MAG: hypothetical protein R3B95_00910 [Nitrospirales bacterium]|nr:hypothetical protein [Nitrospirales bacterium]